MRRAPTLMHWVIAGLVVTLAGVGYDVARAMPQHTLPGAMRHVTRAATPGAADVQAAVLLQLNDCSGNLRMLHVLHRGSTPRRIQLAVIWYVGPESDSTHIRAALPSWTGATPLRAAPPAVVQQFASLGHTTTPALLVLDQDGRVRFTTQSPRSSREVAGLRRIIEGLTWIEEL